MIYICDDVSYLIYLEHTPHKNVTLQWLQPLLLSQHKTAQLERDTKLKVVSPDPSPTEHAQLPKTIHLKSSHYKL